MFSAYTDAGTSSYEIVVASKRLRLFRLLSLSEKLVKRKLFILKRLVFMSTYHPPFKNSVYIELGFFWEISDYTEAEITYRKWWQKVRFPQARSLEIPHCLKIEKKDYSAFYL